MHSRDMKRAFLLLMVPLSGCALVPDALRLESAHLSHIEQHFRGDNFGHTQFGVTGVWQHGALGFEVGDYYSLERFDGYHEVFEARVAYTIPVKAP